MAGYDEDFWGEDFLEGEEGATEGEETEVVETEETAEDSAAEDSGAEDEGIGTETDGGDPGSTAEEGQEFSPDLLARIEAETQKRVDARIAREFEGILNPYTNQPIRTEADLTAYRSAFAAEEQRQQLEEMGVSKEVLDSYIQNHPAMQQAQQVKDQLGKANSDLDQAAQALDFGLEQSKMKDQNQQRCRRVVHAGSSPDEQSRRRPEHPAGARGSGWQRNRPEIAGDGRQRLGYGGKSCRIYWFGCGRYRGPQ